MTAPQDSVPGAQHGHAMTPHECAEAALTEANRYGQMIDAMRKGQRGVLASVLTAAFARAVAAALPDLSTHHGKIDNLRRALSVIDTRDPELHRLLAERNIKVVSLDGGQSAFEPDGAFPTSDYLQHETASEPSAEALELATFLRKVIEDGHDRTSPIAQQDKENALLIDGVAARAVAAERAKPAASDLERRADGNAHVSFENLPGFHFLLIPGEDASRALLFAINEFSGLYIAAVRAEARAKGHREGESAMRRACVRTWRNLRDRGFSEHQIEWVAQELARAVSEDI